MPIATILFWAVWGGAAIGMWVAVIALWGTRHPQQEARVFQIGRICVVVFLAFTFIVSLYSAVLVENNLVVAPTVEVAP